ncbi:respiratory chain complex I subunit 1 family protein [Sphingomonas abietis]|uniref:NADH-quinone oxidoreductase subunit H n=1 Tax=Sphingomonas abietis TaxID=3012344 RepID=A0ABY7NS55_9SPHN|nr:complex I subunit 1 family protein [Sphingomonas abietis]WBO24386.1 NADH-quinone oxidoreductase subunit H [Sphingomonas abietis]
MTEIVLRILSAVLIFPGGVFAIALGLLLKGVERRLVARLQRRIGPPLLQPFYDLAKLMQKETFVPDLADAGLFLLTPMIGVASMSVAMALLPMAGVYTPSAALGDLIILFYLISLPALALMLSGSASGSPFGALGFSREMAMMLAYEGPILLVIVSVALYVGQATGGGVTFDLVTIVRYQINHGPLLLEWRLAPALLAYLAFIPANLGMPPFDIPEAETELAEGPLLEYSGSSLGLLKLGAAIKAVVVTALGITLFWPNGPAGVAGVLVFIAKHMLVVGGLALLKAGVGRMRIDQAVLFYLKWPMLLGGVALVAVRA